MASLEDVNDDECSICYHLINSPRVLDCDHQFCLQCLEGMADPQSLTCTICGQVTNIPEGTLIKHLPRPYSGIDDDVTLVTTITLDVQIADVLADDASGLFYVGVADDVRAIRTYGMNGKERSALSCDRNLAYCRLAKDSKRGLLLATDTDPNQPAIATFDGDGVHTGSVTCPEFHGIDSIAYHVGLDVYLVSDRVTQSVLYMDPRINTVVRAFPTHTTAPPGEGNVNLTCDKTGSVYTWATCNSHTHSVQVHDVEGACIKHYSSHGNGHGEFDCPRGLYMDGQGRVVVSDWRNARMVKVDLECYGEEGEWEAVVSTGHFNLGGPRNIDVTDDGLAAVVMWDKPEGPDFHVGLFTGFEYI